MLDVKSKGVHKGVACESCHGPLAAHADDPASVHTGETGYEVLCARLPPGERRQAEDLSSGGSPAEHSGGAACNTCHKPHSPAIERGGDAMTMTRRQSHPAARRRYCLGVHSGRDAGSVAELQHVGTLVGDADRHRRSASAAAVACARANWRTKFPTAISAPGWSVTMSLIGRWNIPRSIRRTAARTDFPEPRKPAARTSLFPSSAITASIRPAPRCVPVGATFDFS